MTTREGGCQCDAVRYELTGPPLRVVVCHCKECQRQSGSAFGMSVAVRENDFRLLRGAPKRFVRKTDSGRELECFFCPDCGTRIYHKPQGIGPVLNVKPGTLDDTTWLEPTLHAWIARKQRWVEIPTDLQAFETQPQPRSTPAEEV
jgi:hypothetical protein